MEDLDISQLNYKIRVQDANKKDIPKICTDEQLQDYINECSIRNKRN